jgi:hypothetical protein
LAEAIFEAAHDELKGSKRREEKKEKERNAKERRKSRFEGLKGNVMCLEGRNH